MSNELKNLFTFYSDALDEITFHLNDPRLSAETKIERVRKAIDETVGHKICLKCDEIKKYAEFKINEDTYDGFDSTCKECAI